MNLCEIYPMISYILFVREFVHSERLIGPFAYQRALLRVEKQTIFYFDLYIGIEWTIDFI